MGLEYSKIIYEQESTQLDFLPLKIGEEMKMPESLPYDKRDGSSSTFEDWKKFGKQMALNLKWVPMMRIPAPKQVKGLVEETVQILLAVLIKHNLLEKDAQKYLKKQQESPDQRVTPPDGVVRVWKASNKLLQILLQKYQTYVQEEVCERFFKTHERLF